jgi:hypothetical protein
MREISLLKFYEVMMIWTRLLHLVKILERHKTNSRKQSQYLEVAQKNHELFIVIQEYEEIF